jgi:hypothetical protein
MSSAMPDIDEDSESNPRNGLSKLSGHSMKWDNNHKGYLTDSERHAKEADKGGKGYLDQEEARSLGTKITDLSQANAKIRRILWSFIMLVILLCGATIAATYFAIRTSRATVVNQFGRLEAADGSGEVAVKSQGIKISTYNVEGSSSGTKVCVTASDLALAWYENENGGVATFIVENDLGDEQILRLSPTYARMTQDVVSFGDLELYPDPECNPSGDSSTSTPGDANRNLKEHVRSLREGMWNERELKRKRRREPFMMAFRFSDSAFCEGG